jgi:maleylpyruvate isomerase
MTPPTPQDFEPVRAAHAALLDHLDALTGTAAGDAALPSLLPGWTRGHVLTHLARNADSFVRALAAGDAGEVVMQYEGGAEGRAADIEAGAPRPWDDQVADVRGACARLETAFAAQRRWDLVMLRAPGVEVPLAELPFNRLREVVVHHADLGDAGYTPADWPAEYVREDLRRMAMRYGARSPMGAGGLPAAALQAEPVRRLCWLLGRVEIEGVEHPGTF